MTTPNISSAWSSSTIDTHRIDESDPQSMALLKAAYESVYAPIFNEENGGERLDQWEARLRDYTRKTRYVIIVTGKNLMNTTDGQRNIMGLAVGIYYKEADVGLLGYLTVSPQARNQGVAKTSWQALTHSFVDEAAKHDKPLHALLTDCNNPDLVSVDDDMFDPRIRLAMYKGWGGRIIDFDYVCPQDDKHRNMLLLSFPHPTTHRMAAPDDVTAFLTGYYKAFGITPAEDPDYINMCSQLAQRAAADGSIFKSAMPRPK